VKLFVSGRVGVDNTVPAPVGAYRQTANDPHLVLLSKSAFDALTDVLDTPPAPSEGATQTVAHARSWRR
jgi:uncharacterized protein (DUF1778 family)